MNVIRTDYEDYTEIKVVDVGGQVLYCYTYDDKVGANAFMDGWRSCQSVINSLVQRLPQSYERQKA